MKEMKEENEKREREREGGERMDRTGA